MRGIKSKQLRNAVAGNPLAVDRQYETAPDGSRRVTGARFEYQKLKKLIGKRKIRGLR